MPNKSMTYSRGGIERRGSSTSPRAGASQRRRTPVELSRAAENPHYRSRSYGPPSRDRVVGDRRCHDLLGRDRGRLHVIRFLWFYAAEEKLFDQNATMPVGLAKSYSGSFIDSFPGTNTALPLL